MEDYIIYLSGELGTVKALYNALEAKSFSRFSTMRWCEYGCWFFYFIFLLMKEFKDFWCSFHLGFTSFAVRNYQILYNCVHS